MNLERAEKIANAVLYEGYMLYPYRPSSTKNRQRWNFGTLYPADYEETRRGSERAGMHVECLLANHTSEITIRTRFLQFGARPDHEQWDEAVERSAEFTVNLHDAAQPLTFSFPGNTGAICGSVHLRVEELRENLSKLSLDLLNQTPLAPSADRNQALLSSLISAHVILYTECGQFISLLDPPADLRDAVASCKNSGCFPVLVGDAGERQMLLCSPIILYDYPEVAPESAGDFFDGTEMDEMLTLRVLTMTDEEKHEMAGAGDRLRQLLERTERTAREQLLRTHGVVRSLKPPQDDAA